MKLLAPIVVASIVRLKVAVGAVFVAVPVAPAAGVFAVTVGAADVAVVKLHVYADPRATPSADRTPVVSRAV